MIDAEFDDLELNYAAFLPADRDAAILDVGCGTGRVLAFLSAKGFQRLEGFDRDPEAIAVARTRSAATLHVAENWPDFLSGRAAAYDCIVLKDVIYYVPRERAVEWLTAVRRALKPGGRVIVETFNGASFTGPFVAHKDEAILWIVTERTLRKFLERAGFTAVTLLPQRPPQRTIRRRLFNLAGFVWRGVLRAIYFAERGLAEENPRIFTTRIIAVGTADGSAGAPPHVPRH